MDWIKAKADDLYRKHRTRNPFKMAGLLNIHVVFWDLHEEINGFYQYEKHNQIIFINNNLSSLERPVVCAHELGHAILHKKSSVPFMRKSTEFSIDRIEKEANQFAAELLIPDEDFAEINNAYKIASLRGVPVELVKLKHQCKEGLF